MKPRLHPLRLLPISRIFEEDSLPPVSYKQRPEAASVLLHLAHAAGGRRALGRVPSAEPEALEANKTGGVVLIVTAGDSLHRGDMRIVERQRRFPAAGNDVA